jgi:hypothetical protein
MPPPCYSGPIPVTDEERIVIWRWAKLNGIDHGLPFDKIHDAINQKFFAGMAKPEWINDILSGRKTPFRELSNAAWKAQYNRRQIILQAQNLVSEQGQSPVARTLQRLWDFPRAASVFGHGVVFPVTHGGDLALRPQSWGVFMRGLLNTWSKSWSPAKTELLLNSMKRQPFFDTAVRSGLDVSGYDPFLGLEKGERPQRTDQILRTGKGGVSERAWSILTHMRFDLWNHEMQKFIKPDTPQAEVLEIGKDLAEWANHATGSAKGGLSRIPGVSNVIFGPKLTQSKLNRLFADPVKTVKTFADWDNASAGEKAAAWTRLSGMTQYFGTGLGLLAVNQGVLWATNQKNQQINFTDPSKSDWLAFKGGGMEWSIPGMHSEFKNLGQILAASYASYKWADPKYKAAMKARRIKPPWPAPDPLKEAGQYLRGKLNPAASIGVDVLKGENFIGKPTPWSANPGTADWPREDWWQYSISHGPIPLSGPIRYFYDQLKQRGASALEAVTITKALILFGVGATGLHIHEDYGAAKEAAKREQVARSLQNR